MCLLAAWSTTYNFPKEKEREKAIQKKFERTGKTFDFPSGVTKKTLLTFSPLPSFRAGWISQLFSAFSPFWVVGSEREDRRKKVAKEKEEEGKKSSFFF